MRDCLPKQTIAGKRSRRGVVVGTQAGEYSNPVEAETSSNRKLTQANS
jgi:hypothetical protein